ncbi:hypothetical protein CcCBS67573_g08964 [Chytriomyces confervae]|uniref:Uncharacterized protein n=1 Tax=Chytriomyces confervae TaxID=246404 RepID=A0A507EC29_9FUNG|nr:hypothetical protein HDU80_010425 [Chytriomyces hyalinus]TPX60885.1 hypothetical protein CcCBS67573_g08964 [Chytriomyces confervae]
MQRLFRFTHINKRFFSSSPAATPDTLSKFMRANQLLASNNEPRTMLQLMKEAAEEGNSDAQVTLAHLLLNGHAPASLAPDANEAFKWTLRSGESGNIGAQCRLAVMCASGVGTQPSETSAFEWTRRAAENTANSPEAMAALGVLYYQGRGVTQNLSEAFVWTKKAADAGLLEAQSLVGDMFYHGLGTDVDMPKAFEYTKLAANQGHVFSQLKISSMYLMGDGVKSDVDLAKEWAKKATGEEIDFVNPGQWLHDQMEKLMEAEVEGR